MKNLKIQTALKLSVLFLLLASMTLAMISCGGTKSGTDTTAADTTVSESSQGTASAEDSEKTTVKITVTVVSEDGTSKDHEISTSASNLGDALITSGIAVGVEDSSGLYIKVVDGVRADYDTDGAYWMLSKNGTALTTGASSTKLADGDQYEITWTKA